MAIRTAETIHSSYLDYESEQERRDLYELACKRKTTEPLFQSYDFHPDDEPVKQELIDELDKIKVDVFALDTECQGQADDYSSLVSDLTTRLKNIRGRVAKSGQKISDINLLCGYYPEFSNIVDVSELTLTGDYSYCGNSTFCAAMSKRSGVDYEVTGVVGNGYEGNDYVVYGGGFLAETNPTKDRALLTDHILDTAYEYSRILSNNTGSDYDIAQKDEQQAACTVELTGKSSFNMLLVYSDSSLVLDDVAVCSDTRYEWQNRPAQKLLDQPNFSCICATFPQALKAKVVLSQTAVNGDVIGVSSSSSIKMLPDARRSAIRVCAIDAVSAEFYKTSVFKTPELLKTTMDSISILATEYAPTGSVEYVLTVNGKDYNVVPMNSQKNGTKVIRYSTAKSEDDYITTIGEKISSASLTISINTASAQETPLVSGIRVCLGGASA